MKEEIGDTMHRHKMTFSSTMIQLSMNEWLLDSPTNSRKTGWRLPHHTLPWIPLAVNEQIEMHDA